LPVNSGVCYVLNVGFSQTSAAFCVTLLAGNATAQERDPFTDLHERARQAEKELVSLRADFVETTESSLLAVPIVEKGKLSAARPIRVSLRYENPETKRIVIDGDRFLIAWPERGRVEERQIAEIQENVDKYFYQASEEQLRKLFDVTVTSDPELPNTSRVEMIAKRKQIKEGIERLVLWLEDQSLYMVKMRLVYPRGGGTKTIELSNLVANVPLDDEEFQIEYPSQSSKRPSGFQGRNHQPSGSPPHQSQ
jgi:outer membrane lipoprotein-sorting protein